MTTTTLEVSAPSTLTIAKTGTVAGHPAMIAFDGKKTVLLVLNETADGWDQIEEVAFSGIRGMGLLTKRLDSGSARRADETPVFHQKALTEEAAPADEKVVEPIPAPAETPAVPAKAKAEKAPKADTAPVKPPAPVGPVLDPAIVAHLGNDRALEVATTTDLTVLRTLRESVVKLGLPAAVVKAITLRAGEVACGFSLASMKRTTKAPAQSSTTPTTHTRGGDWKKWSCTVAERMEGQKAIDINAQSELEPAGFGHTSWTTKNSWYPKCPGGKALLLHGLKGEYDPKTGVLLVTREAK